MWQISHFTKCTKNFNSAFKNLPQASANNLEMHKLFIKAAAQNTVLPHPHPVSFRGYLLYIYVIYIARVKLCMAVEVEEAGAYFCMAALNPDSNRIAAMD